MDPIIQDALRLALQRRRYDFGGQVEWSAPKEPEPVKQPDEEEQEKFLKEQLEGSAPQYEPEAGLKTAKEAGLMAAGFAPGSGIASAAGAFPTAEGGFEPSLREDISAGRYGSAALKAAGAAGDVVSAIPVAGTAAGALLKAPLAAKLAMAAAPMAKVAKEAVPAVRAAEEVAEAAPAYQRLVNPAGFYSRAHEVAMTELPDQPRTWQEMHSLLSKAPRVQKEELYWSGIHPETFAPDEKVSREQIAELIEKNFPKVHPEIRTTAEAPELQKLQEAHKQSQQAYNQLEDQYTNVHAQIGDPDVPNAYEFTSKFFSDRPAALEMAQSLPEELRGPASALIDQMRSHESLARELNDVRSSLAGRPLPKYETYTVPGGTDYEERILKHAYSPRGEIEIHPEVEEKYSPQRQEINAERNKLADEINRAKLAYKNNVVQPYVADMREQYVQKLLSGDTPVTTPEELAASRAARDAADAERKQAAVEYQTMSGENFADRYEYERAREAARARGKQANKNYEDLRNRHFELYVNSEEGVREDVARLSPEMVANLLGKFEEFRQVRNGHLDATADLERQYSAQEQRLKDLRNQMLQESQERMPYAPEYTQQRYAHSHWPGIDNPVVHTRNSTRTGPNGEKIWHQEEIQSDWAQQGREQGFKDPVELKKAEKRRNEIVDEKAKIDKQYAAQHGPSWQNNPDLVSKYLEQTQALSDEENKLENLLSSKGLPSAPYTRDTEHWLELAAKDTLKEAIERGYDKIFITGGQEQAKRWANELRQAVDNVRWENAPNTEDVKNILAQNKWNENYANLTSWQQQQVDRHILENPQDLPDAPRVKTVYAKPAGSNEEHRFVVKQVEGPGGKPRFEVVDSSIPKAKGETLSSVIGGDLAKRVMAEESGDVPMKGYVMGSEGYSQTYERKAPSIYKKLLKSLDPEAKVESGKIGEKESLTPDEIFKLSTKLTDEQSDDWDFSLQQIFEDMVERGMPYAQAVKDHAPPDLVDYLAQQKVGAGGTYIQITPKMRAEYNRLKQKYGAVFPAYKRGGAVDANVNASYNDRQRRLVKDALKITRRYTD